MEKISAYIFSFSLLLMPFPNYGQTGSEKPDSVDFPLNIRAGMEVTGPLIYFTNKNLFNAEFYASVDLNERHTVFLGGGISDFAYSQYNYEYKSSGFYLKTGVDFNLLKPQTSSGKYWGGIGIRYGLSSFRSETPSFWHENYWGRTISSLPESSYLGHYIEIAPGFRAEMFSHFSMGWSISLRRLLFSSAGRDLRPIYFPGFGPGANQYSAGIGYYFTWNIPYKTIRVKAITDKEPEAATSTPQQQNQGR
jgi:hypothetical protein